MEKSLVRVALEGRLEESPRLRRHNVLKHYVLDAKFNPSIVPQPAEGYPHRG